MRGFLRFTFLCALSLVLSYWFLLYKPGATWLPAGGEGEEQPLPLPIALNVAPEVSEPLPPTDPAPPPAAPEKPAEKKPDPRPEAESGVHDGEEEGVAPKAADSESKKALEEVQEFARNKALLDQAASELAGKTRRGFTTTFSLKRDMALRGEELIAVARHFEEPVVLVPKSGLDPDNPHYYRLELSDKPRVVRVDEKPPLERFRQTHNLFKLFPAYRDLPEPLRALRRAVPNRGDVYLFASLIPPSEWAVVIGRRAQALAAYNERRPGPARTLEDVKRVRMDYVALEGGGYDIRVDRIFFTDGSSYATADES
ncbi:MAG: hypothetical protein ACYTGN_13235 [Planctomycetota bacterium]|jgi:hypothetical protein